MDEESAIAIATAYIETMIESKAYAAGYTYASIIYDSDIAERLCTPSELKKTRNGERKPNSREEWLDVQARALRQAFSRIYTAAF